ncbi:integrase [Candidatus Woesearchaeota archaeon CG10_big_fil_rev_8_21_14_0_10_30_7]|nr:MAG: integrase [Candidatus Woesearchaeota archaeon CG10_big_fil_rev_8_21_14_0_10_30_7]
MEYDFCVMRKELKLRNYSEKTVKAYLYHNMKFLEWSNKSLREVNQKDLENYLLYKSSLDAHSRHLITASLRFYYCEILKRRFRWVYPKREKHLPLVLSKEEILRMIDVTNNLKHKLMIELLYSSGLRVSELVKVKNEDINVEEKIIMIREGKGRKDRLVILSEKFLQDYKKFNQNNKYLFYSERDCKKDVSIRTVQKIIKNAAKKACVRNVYCHALRASFATHLLENNTDIYSIQKLLGHSSVKTTQGYIRTKTDFLKKIKSPLDC